MQGSFDNKFTKDSPCLNTATEIILILINRIKIIICWIGFSQQ